LSKSGKEHLKFLYATAAAMIQAARAVAHKNRKPGHALGLYQTLKAKIEQKKTR
jgi:hypothetical protein